MKYINKVFLVCIVIYLTACSIPPEQMTARHDDAIKDHETKSQRVLVLSGNEFVENDSSEFISWKCSDYISDGETLVEFGQITMKYDYKSNKEYEALDNKDKELANDIARQLGFVLYDGTNKGDIAMHNRNGLNHRWDWGPEGKYSFIIKPDGTGLFYDFTSAEPDESIKANDVYKCKKF